MFQVKELEGGVSTHSPFIVVDHFALIRNLNVVRRIVEAKKFAVVIPSAGIKGKDARRNGQPPNSQQNNKAHA
jgi:hypothetical protein